MLFQLILYRNEQCNISFSILSATCQLRRHRLMLKQPGLNSWSERQSLTKDEAVVVERDPEEDGGKTEEGR